MRRMQARRAGRPRGRPAKSRDEIVAAAGEVFRDAGYEAARMDDVATRLGITKGSLYHSVATTEALLIETVVQPYREAVEHRRGLLRSDRPVEEVLAAVVRRHLRNVRDHYPAISVYLEQGRSLPVPDEVRALDREYVAGLRRLVLAGMRDGSLDVADPATTTAALLGMCNWFAIHYDPADPRDVDDVADDFVRILLDGIRRRR